MLEFLGFLLFCVGALVFALLLFNDIKWLCYKSKLLFWSCCKKRNLEEEKQKEEGPSK